MDNYAFPTSAELTEIDPVLFDQRTMDDPIFQFFPIESDPIPRLIWRQMDAATGMMQWRGLDAQPRLIPKRGHAQFEAKPGVFGEFDVIDEAEMTLRARMGSWADRVDVSSLVAERQDTLMHRHIVRIKWLIWTLVSTGYYVVLDETGTRVDYASYVPKTYTAPVAWSNHATATPLANFRAAKLLARGQSVGFGSGSVAMMSEATAQELYANTNAADLGGKRTEGLASIAGLEDANRFLAREDLPRVVVYEGGYLDDSGAWQTWIPDGTVVLIGRRENNARLGAFRYTLNRVNPGVSAAPYVRVVPLGMNPDQAPPPRIEVHRGFSGGPVIFYGGAIVLMRV
jgi:hypothetical protein